MRLLIREGDARSAPRLVELDEGAGPVYQVPLFGESIPTTEAWRPFSKLLD